jgi:hypothetical protein
VSGNTTPDVLDDYNSGLLILEDRAVNKENSIETTVFSFSDITFDLNKEMIVQWLPLLEWIGIIVGIFVFIFFFVGKMISALIVSVIGLLLSSIQKAGTSFGELYIIAIYALTLPSIFNVLSAFIGFNFPWYLYYGVTLVYVWLAIKNLKHNLSTEETENLT